VVDVDDVREVTGGVQEASGKRRAAARERLEPRAVES